jgi:trehalose/maltose hydrolase-like predicted phosphorylase
MARSNPGLDTGLVPGTTAGMVLRDTRFVRDLHGWREALFTLANGTLSVRGAFAEPVDGGMRATFLQGAYVTTPGALPRQTAIPDATGLQVVVDGHPLRLDRGELLGFERRLDMGSATITRTVIWRAPGTAAVRIVHRRVVPLSHPWHVGTDVLVTPLDAAATIDVVADLDPGIGSPDEPAWERTGGSPDADLLTLVARSVDGRHDLALGRRIRGPGDRWADEHGGRVRAGRTRRLEPGDHLHVEAVAAHRLRLDHWPARGHLGGADTGVEAGTEPRAEAGRPAGTWQGHDDPGDVTVDELVAASHQAWARRWRDIGIEVPGDPEVEFALRFAAFHLVGAASRDARASLGAKLLSGFGYGGHVFWDTDVFIVPWLTVAAPDLARHHLDYRHRTLPAARRRAREFGRQGAFFAWESADTGDDVTPSEVMTPSGEMVEIHTGRLQEHVVGDVAWSVDQHLAWTGDDDWLGSRGLDLLVQTATYWEGRVELDAAGSGHLRHVIGPDEYHTDIDDSAFNNAIAAHTLRQAADWLDRVDDATAAAALDRGGVDPATAGEWPRLADALVIPRADDVLLQYDGLHDLPMLDLDLWSPMRGNLEKVIARDVEHWRVIKQADVVMLLAMLPDVARNGAEAAAAFDRYLPLCEHGSSLSMGTHAQVAARLGRTDLAHELLHEAIAIDLDDSHGNGHQGLHAATLGGILQAVLFGFAGLAPGRSGPRTAAALPDHWDGLSFTAWHHGRRHEVEVTA